MSKIKTDHRIPSRRSALAMIAMAVLGSAMPARVRGAGLPPITVTKDPNCGCCSGWADHLRKAGFPVRIVESTDLQPLKKRLGVPDELSACHTAEIGRYVIEGHVPAVAIQRLLREAPDAVGLAVPGMPVGSPGMEGGTPEIYEVILFGPGKRVSFGRYREDREI